MALHSTKPKFLRYLSIGEAQDHTTLLLAFCSNSKPGHSLKSDSICATMVSETHPHHTQPACLCSPSPGPARPCRVMRSGGTSAHMPTQPCSLLSACLHIPLSSPQLEILKPSFAAQVTTGNRIPLFLEEGSHVVLTMLCRLSFQYLGGQGRTESEACLVSHNKQGGVLA